MLTKNKFFKDWLYEEVELAFGLTCLRDHPLLTHLKSLTLDPHDPRRPAIEQLRLILFDYINSWNEDEYKFMFISPFLALVPFVSPHYKVFTQRPMRVKYEQGTKTTEGLVEFMLAKGKQTPRKPHFFLHEYKPEKRRDNDPLGQLLIAMVAAQHLNEDNLPIYGIYVNGRNWFLVVLDGQTYAVSNPFIATSEQIFDLFAVLDYFKTFMEELYREG
jgi:hypothetical protein